MKPILIVKPNSISKYDKNNLIKEGIIVIEHDNSSEITTFTELRAINDNEFLIASVDSILNNNYADHCKKLFGENVLSLIKKRLDKKVPMPPSK